MGDHIKRAEKEIRRAQYELKIAELELDNARVLEEHRENNKLIGKYSQLLRELNNEKP